MTLNWIDYNLHDERLQTDLRLGLWNFQPWKASKRLQKLLTCKTIKRNVRSSCRYLTSTPCCRVRRNCPWWLILCCETSQTTPPATLRISLHRWRRHLQRPRSHRRRTRRTCPRTATSRTTSMRLSRRTTKTAPKVETLTTHHPTLRTRGKRRRERYFHGLKSSSWSRRLTWKGRMRMNWCFRAWGFNHFRYPTDTSVLPNEPAWLHHSGSQRRKSKSGEQLFSRFALIAF